MYRTTIVLPARLKAIAMAQARSRGLSFGEFVRRALEKAIAEDGGRKRTQRDPFWSDRAVYRGSGPRDLARRHDDYLYGDS